MVNPALSIHGVNAKKIGLKLLVKAVYKTERCESMFDFSVGNIERRMKD